jgi:hypothetical protein
MREGCRTKPFVCALKYRALPIAAERLGGFDGALGEI